MQIKNAEIMMRAREALAGKWGLAVGTTLVYYLILGLSRLVPFLPLFLSGPMVLGMTYFSLNFTRKNEVRTEQIFDGFKHFGTALVASLLTTLYTVLWMLLLIVPGIIAAVSYALTFYIIADNPTMSATEAIRESKKMMRGNKWKLFCLGFRFIGWLLLCILTLGIGLLWLSPYMHVSIATFYDEVKKQYTKSE